MQAPIPDSNHQLQALLTQPTGSVASQVVTSQLCVTCFEHLSITPRLPSRVGCDQDLSLDSVSASVLHRLHSTHVNVVQSRSFDFPGNSPLKIIGTWKSVPKLLPSERVRFSALVQAALPNPTHPTPAPPLSPTPKGLSCTHHLSQMLAR